MFESSDDTSTNKPIGATLDMVIARMYLADKNYQQAKKYLGSAVKDFPEASLLLAGICLKLGNYREAEVWLRDVNFILQHEYYFEMLGRLEQLTSFKMLNSLLQLAETLRKESPKLDSDIQRLNNLSKLADELNKESPSDPGIQKICDDIIELLSDEKLYRIQLHEAIAKNVLLSGTVEKHKKQTPWLSMLLKFMEDDVNYLVNKEIELSKIYQRLKEGYYDYFPENFKKLTSDRQSRLEKQKPPFLLFHVLCTINKEKLYQDNLVAFQQFKAKISFPFDSGKPWVHEIFQFYFASNNADLACKYLTLLTPLLPSLAEKRKAFFVYDYIFNPLLSKEDRARRTAVLNLFQPPKNLKFIYYAVENNAREFMCDIFNVDGAPNQYTVQSLDLICSMKGISKQTIIAGVNENFARCISTEDGCVVLHVYQDNKEIMEKLFNPMKLVHLFEAILELDGNGRFRNYLANETFLSPLLNGQWGSRDIYYLLNDAWYNLYEYFKEVVGLTLKQFFDLAQSETNKSELTVECVEDMKKYLGRLTVGVTLHATTANLRAIMNFCSDAHEERYSFANKRIV